MTATAVKKILIVYDQTEDIHVLIGALESEYDVSCATNGEKALSVARSDNRPDLVLVDVMMPGLSGCEICRQLKNDATTRDISLILITEQTEEIGEEGGFRFGAVDCITKPFCVPVVRARVKIALQLKEEREKRLALEGRVEELGNHFEEQVRKKTRELQVAHENLTVCEKKLRTIFKNALTGIYQTEPGGKVLHVSSSFARRMGFGKIKPLLARRPNCVTYYCRSDDRKHYWTSPAAEKEVTGCEIRFRNESGEIARDMSSAKIISGETGTIQISQGAAIDVARQIRAVELELANIRLQELDALKSALMSTAFHDLRSPLTALLGFGELIANCLNKHFLPLFKDNERLAVKSEKIAKYLENINHESHRLMQMVNDFLNLSKLESVNVKYHDRMVQLDELISRAVQVVGEVLGEGAQARLKAEFSPDLPEVFCDPDRMLQVMINLLTNALAVSPAGIIGIQARTIAQDQVEVRVSDNGPAISEDDKYHIFDKYHQVRKHCNSGAAALGTALGPIICKQIVEHYGGRIWVESAGDSGNIFVFRIPAAPQPEKRK